MLLVTLSPMRLGVLQVKQQAPPPLVHSLHAPDLVLKWAPKVVLLVSWQEQLQELQLEWEKWLYRG